MHSANERLFVAFLVISGVLGLLAILKPRLFELVATKGARWIDSRKIIESLDKQVNVDRYVLPYSRTLGVAVLASVAVLGYVFIHH